MDSKQIFEKYKKRLVIEGVIKSAVLGLAAGFGVDFIIAFITWFTPFNGLWLAVGLGLGVAVVTGVLLYFLKFKPTDIQVARRIDGMGLDERMITMHEFRGDESFIADIQRKDAVNAVTKAAASGVTFKITASLAAIITAAVLAVFGIGMTVVTGLSASGVIPSAEEILDPDRDIYYEVIYNVVIDYGDGDYEEGGGFIEGGDEAQLVKAGEDAVPVFAVEEEGFMFVQWSDGLTEPARWDLKIGGDFEVDAIFARVGENDDDNQGDGDDGDEDGDSAEDEPQEGDQNGDQDDEENQNPGQEAGGSYEEGDKIIDGDTYYKDVYDTYYQEAMDKLANNETLPDYLKDFVEKYLNGLK